MILLIDEEIMDKQYYFDKYIEPHILEGSKAIAKAQLKKVVEWLEQYHIKVIEGDPTDIPAVYSDCGYHIPTKDVQALLEEVSEAPQ